MERSKIVVLDFGSQYAHLIAKRFRMLGYYSEIALPSTSLEVFENCKGIVFSGGPSSVYDEKVPEFNSDILKLDISGEDLETKNAVEEIINSINSIRQNNCLNTSRMFNILIIN